MNSKKFTEKNREAWNEAMPYHQRGRKIDLYKKFENPNFMQISEIEKQTFLKLKIQDKRVLHLCCNNGIELISIIRLGAKYGVGIDISDEAITEAKKFATIAKANCDFYRLDVYEASPDNYGFFDFNVLIASANFRTCLCWNLISSN